MSRSTGDDTAESACCEVVAREELDLALRLQHARLGRRHCKGAGGGNSWRGVTDIGLASILATIVRLPFAELGLRD